MLTISSVICVSRLFWGSMRGSADVGMFSLSVSLENSRRLHLSALATSVCALRLAASAARERRKGSFLFWDGGVCSLFSSVSPQ